MVIPVFALVYDKFLYSPLSFCYTIMSSNNFEEEGFLKKKIYGKGENAGNQHFSHFPSMFSTL